MAPPFFVGWIDSTLPDGHRCHGLELFVELHGQALAANGENFQGVLVHPQLGIGHLHSTHQLLQLIREGVQVITLPFEGQHGVGIVRCGVGHRSCRETLEADRLADCSGVLLFSPGCHG